MTSYLYVSADGTSGQDRAAVLGCGWVPAVPAQYANNVAKLPAVLLAYSGVAVTLDDSAGNVTPAQVQTAAAPLVTQEAADRTAAAALTANDAATQTALAAAMTRLTQIGNQGTTLAGQSTAWTVAQQKAVAQGIADMAVIQRQLIRRAIGLFDGST